MRAGGSRSRRRAGQGGLEAPTLLLQPQSPPLQRQLKHSRRSFEISVLDVNLPSSFSLFLTSAPIGARNCNFPPFLRIYFPKLYVCM